MRPLHGSKWSCVAWLKEESILFKRWVRKWEGRLCGRIFGYSVTDSPCTLSISKPSARDVPFLSSVQTCFFFSPHFESLAPCCCGAHWLVKEPVWKAKSVHGYNMEHYRMSNWKYTPAYFMSHYKWCVLERPQSLHKNITVSEQNAHIPNVWTFNLQLINYSIKHLLQNLASIKCVHW